MWEKIILSIYKIFTLVTDKSTDIRCIEIICE